MEILDKVRIVDLGLFLEESKTLIISDIHIGYEEALNKQGVLVPRIQFKDIFLKLTNLLEYVKPKTVVVNGDLKHEFGRVSEQEWRDTLKILDLIGNNCEKIILVKGNHDTILGPIARKRNLEVVDEVKIGDILITHGDRISETKAPVIIIGHEHPAITLRKGIRQEKFKCFLKGSYRGSTLIVLPSFFLVTEGTDVQREEILSPYLKQPLKDFEVFVVAEGNVFNFGKLKELR